MIDKSETKTLLNERWILNLLHNYMFLKALS